MKKVLTLIVALVALGAIPSIAAAQPGVEIDQDADVVRSPGATVGQQAAGCQFQGGGPGDRSCSIDQSQNINRNVTNRVGVTRFGQGGHVHGHGGFGVGGAGVTGVGGVSGGGVGGVTLARTGADAWILALIGGLAVAGGVGILAAQRRGRLNA
jgi:hypothetical protein